MLNLQSGFKLWYNGSMKLREEYPIYLDPDFAEVLEICKVGWDTLRVGTFTIPYSQTLENEHLVIASGYGNIHTTLAHAIRDHFRNKRIMMDPYILHHRGGIAYFNLEDVGGSQYARYEKWSGFFRQEHVEIFKDIIRESGLAL